MEEGRAGGRHATGVLAQHPVVEAAVDLGNHVEQRVVEDVDDGVGLLDGRGLLERNGARAQQGIDLLQHVALVLREVGAAQARALLEQAGDAADLALDGLPAGLGGVRGEDGVELEALEQLGGAVGAGLVNEPLVGDGKRVGLVHVGVEGDLALAVVESLDAEVLLGEVGEVEVSGEGTRHHRLPLHVEPVDELVGTAEALVLLAGASGAHHAALVGGDEVCEQLVEGGAQLGAVLGEDLAQQAQEQLHVVAEALGQLHAGESLGRLRLGGGAAPRLLAGRADHAADGGADVVAVGLALVV